jgi:predicted Rossmann fold flavoprotein
MSASYDAIIIGGGAAGLYCALHAGRRGRRVLVLEHNDEVGAKILISGGGRCNFTNLNGADPARYISANPHFARSALTRHGPEAFIALVAKHGIRHYEKTLGQLFCEGAGAARRIVAMLLAECAAAHVDIRTGASVTDVTKAERFRVETNAGSFAAAALVVASGGLSIPKLGAGDLAFRIAAQFGAPVIAPRPGLAPLAFSDADLAWMRTLSGLSADVTARCGGAAFREAALLTHRGLSGPAILQASSYWRVGEAITLDWAPDTGEDWLAARKRERPKAIAKTVLAEIMPARLADMLAQSIAPSPLGDIKDQALTEAMGQIKAFALTPAATEGYAKAEVTVGGVDTNALSQQTMQARAVRGLYFIGECVDVTGWLGGYNFQWAWSSGWCAGQAI